MREIEVKVRLADAHDAVEKLETAGVVLSPPKEQHDVVYCLPGDRDKENDPSVNWLRLRTEDKNTVYFTLKRSVQGSLDSIEHETIVENAAELASIVGYMGYEVFSDLTKIRQTGHVDDIEVCLDQVPSLGSFIELELLCNDDVDGAVIEERLLRTLDELGIKYVERMTKGYDELMNEHLAKE